MDVLENAPPEVTRRKPEVAGAGQAVGRGPGFTIVEVGEKGTTMPPQVGRRTIDRTLRMAAGRQPRPLDHGLPIEAQAMTSQGSNSYLDYLSRGRGQGQERRFYVKSTRGIRPGQFLNPTAGPATGAARTGPTSSRSATSREEDGVTSSPTPRSTHVAGRHRPQQEQRGR